MIFVYMIMIKMTRKTTKRRHTVRFDENEIEVQKSCIPGPRVSFTKVGRKRVLPLYTYLKHVTEAGSLGCGKFQYPKYEDGKYCCTDTQATPQEILDFINLMLERVFENSGPTNFSSQVRTVKYLIERRNQLFNATRPPVEDTLELPAPYNNVYELLHDREAESAHYLITAKRDLPEGMKLPKRRPLLPFQQRLETALAVGKLAEETLVRKTQRSTTRRTR